MKNLLIVAGLVAGGCLLLDDVSDGHGGAYRGPGDSAPPSASSSGGAGAPGSSGSGPGGGSGPAGPAATGGGGSSPSAGKGPTKSSRSTPDLTNWEIWWGFNKEPYLNLKAAIHTSALVSGSDDYFLGREDREHAKDRLRPSDEAVHGRIVPALLEALETETHNEIVTGALIALAKIGDSPPEYGRPKLVGVLRSFLGDSNQEISETAAIALGILASREALAPLMQLLGDTETGRRLVEREHEVPWRTRAFAAYGLGLVAFRQPNEDLKRAVVAALSRALDEARAMATPDLQVACVTAMGLVPLREDPDLLLAAGKTLRPDHGRRGQVEWALDLLAEEDLDHLARAQVPTTLARLVRGTSPDSLLKERAAEALFRTLDRARQREVLQSAVLALGAIGDADEDTVDAAIRKRLVDLSGKGGDLQIHNFALVSLARTGARPGVGAGQPFAATADVRKTLLGFLERGGTAIRPWAGVALGVLGRDLAANGSEPSPEVDDALRASLTAARTPRDVGAFAIAVGLRQDIEARGVLLEKLEQMSDDTARGYVALALGLADAREAQEAIEAIVRQSKYRPELLRQAAISLGLLGDKRIVSDLLDMLERSNSLAARASIAMAIGFIGDARSIDPMIAMLSDREITGGARGFAAVALGIVADKEPLPWNVKLSVGINYRANVETLTNSAGTGILDIL